MKSTLAVSITLTALLAVPATAQMMLGGAGMGGGRRTMVNLVLANRLPDPGQARSADDRTTHAHDAGTAAPAGQASAPRVPR